MNTQLMNDLTKALNGERAFEALKTVTAHHRIQATPMFRRGADEIVKLFNSRGISSEIISFPATGKTDCTTRRTIREWNINSGWCRVAGETLCDYDVNPMSIMARSTDCDFRDTPLQLYMVEKDTEPAEEDLSGKLVFAHDVEQSECRWAIDRGAAGIITDYVTNRKLHYNSTRSTAFWWDEMSGEKKYFGFVITPSQGDDLAEKYRKSAAEGKTLEAECFIDSEFYDGTLDAISALIQGKQEDGEILLTAHYCHPKPSANDNASGCAAIIEALTAIRELIDCGKLEAPRRSIRALLIPEFSGAYEYAELLAAGKAPANAAAALNLDMVGGRASLGYGPIDLTLLPYCTPSFVGDMAAMILKDAAERFEDFAEDENTFNYKICGFHGGSDHSVFSDPTVGVPCPMLGQWPDPYYHTSNDTIDKVSPSVLKASALTAAAYAYTLANFREEEIPDIGAEMTKRLVSDIEEIRAKLRRGILTPDAAARSEAARRDCFLKSADSFLDFVPDAKESVEALKARLLALCVALGVKDTEKVISDSRVFRRTFIGPVDDSLFAATCAGCVPLFKNYLKNHRWRIGGFIQCEIQTQYYIDGKRTVSEVMDCVLADLGYGDREGLLAYIEFLEAAKLIVRV